MKELVRRAKSGDAEAFVTLIEMHRQSFYKIARSYLRSVADVDDAVGETVLACWEKLPALRRNEAFRAWAVRILINKCRDILLRRPDETDADITAIEGETFPPRDGFGELIDALSENERAIFVLFYAEGFKIREIADILGLSAGTVGSRLARGRKRLRDILSRGGGDCER